MDNPQYTAFMKYSRVKGEVEMNGRTIHYTREPLQKGEKQGKGDQSSDRRRALNRFLKNQMTRSPRWED